VIDGDAGEMAPDILEIESPDRVVEQARGDEGVAPTAQKIGRVEGAKSPVMSGSAQRAAKRDACHTYRFGIAGGISALNTMFPRQSTGDAARDCQLAS
jgi:hypothetical protein